MTAEQKKLVEDFQKEADARLAKILTEEQRKQLNKPPDVGVDGRNPPGGAFQPGQLIPLSVQFRLKLNAEQRKQLQDLQKQADAKLDTLLKDEQKKQLKEMRAGRGGPGGPFGGPGGPGGPPGGPGRPGGGPTGNSLFRAYRYPSNYPGFAGKDLTAGKTIEQLEAQGTKPK